MADLPSSSLPGGNPLVALAAAVIYAILYVLGGVKYLVGVLTISFPR
jgi:lysophospholipid hydrolase